MVDNKKLAEQSLDIDETDEVGIDNDNLTKSKKDQKKIKMTSIVITPEVRDTLRSFKWHKFESYSILLERMVRTFNIIREEVEDMREYERETDIELFEKLLKKHQTPNKTLKNEYNSLKTKYNSLETNYNLLQDKYDEDIETNKNLDEITYEPIEIADEAFKMLSADLKKMANDSHPAKRETMAEEAIAKFKELIKPDPEDEL